MGRKHRCSRLLITWIKFGILRKRKWPNPIRKSRLLGSKDSIRQQLTEFQEKYDAQEIMVVSYIFDPDQQKRSYEILKEVVDEA